jgi:hypothetical protein
MADSRQENDTLEPVFVEAPEQPNGPEVAGTSFPLLSTVLAGFGVTIVIQLILHPALGDPSTRVLIALISFLLGTLMFISSIGFALNAQANNYLPFLDLGSTGAQLLNVSDRSNWLRRIVQRWAIYFAAALFSFYIGIALLLAGLNLIVWEFIGGWIALVLLVAIVLNLVIVIYLQRNIDELGQQNEALERTGSRPVDSREADDPNSES